MPKLLRLFLFFVLCIHSVQSQEMAPNPMFEILASPPPCPVGISGYLGSPPLDNVKTCLVNSSNITTWQAISMQPTQNHSSPDYFNSCVTGQCSTGVSSTWAHAPYTYMGYQQPLSGNGFIGVFSLYRSYADGSNGPAYQLDMAEYFYSKLLTPMLKGNTYKVKFFISLARSSDAYVKKNLGAYFTKNILTPSGSQTALAFEPQIHTGMMPAESYDTYTWKPIAGQFIASDNFEYITIGHFKTLPAGAAPYGIDFDVKTRENVCVNHPAPTDNIPQGAPDGFYDDLPIYYYVDTDGLTPMVQECSCDTDLDIVLEPYVFSENDGGNDCCYKIMLKNNGDCIQEIVGLRVKDLGYRYAFAGSGELKVVPQIMQPGDNIGFFVNETYSNSTQNGLQLMPNDEKFLGTICLTPDSPVNGTFGKFILLRNENIGGVYQVKCEKEKEFTACNHSNNCCNQVLKYLKVTSIPSQDGEECCNKIEGAFVQPSNPNCSYSVRIERETPIGSWDIVNNPTTDAQGKFSYTDCSNFHKGRYKIILTPSNGGIPCTFLRTATCRSSCCKKLGQIDVQETTVYGQNGCCYDIRFYIEQGSCLSNVMITPLDNPGSQSGHSLHSGLNVIEICRTGPILLEFGDIWGKKTCERTLNLVCTNCCSKVPDMSGATVVPGPTNSEACCYIVNGTIPNNNGCISKITYNHYNSETDLNEPAEVTVSGNSYSIPICVQSTVNNPNSVSFAFEGANGVSCIRELNLPCTPDCCSRIGNITELYGGNNDCCRTFTGTILFHEQDPCFTSFTYSTYSNGIWIQQNGSIAPNGQFTLSFCVPRTNINYPVQIKFTGEDELECTITLNGQCSGDVGPGEGGN